MVCDCVFVCGVCLWYVCVMFCVCGVFHVWCVRLVFCVCLVCFHLCLFVVCICDLCA